jgi:hypothetical protein
LAKEIAGAVKQEYGLKVSVRMIYMVNPKGNMAKTSNAEGKLVSSQCC